MALMEQSLLFDLSKAFDKTETVTNRILLEKTFFPLYMRNIF